MIAADAFLGMHQKQKPGLSALFGNFFSKVEGGVPKAEGKTSEFWPSALGTPPPPFQKKNAPGASAEAVCVFFYLILLARRD